MTINTQKLRDLIRQACPLPWTLATSNSWRRIVDPYHVPVCSPCNQSDGHPDLAFPGGPEGPTATLLIEAANALPELLSALDAQTAEIAESKAQAWQPIETAPQGQIALFYDANATEVRGCMFVDWMVDGAFCGNRHHVATHWMSLPAAPSALSGESKC